MELCGWAYGGYPEKVKCGRVVAASETAAGCDNLESALSDDVVIVDKQGLKKIRFGQLSKAASLRRRQKMIESTAKATRTSVVRGSKYQTRTTPYSKSSSDSPKASESSPSAQIRTSARSSPTRRCFADRETSHWDVLESCR